MSQCNVNKNRRKLSNTENLVVIFSCILLIVSIVTVILQYNGKKFIIEKGNLKITYDQYKKIGDAMKDDYVGFDICAIGTEDCVRFMNIDNLNNQKVN